MALLPVTDKSAAAEGGLNAAPFSAGHAAHPQLQHVAGNESQEKHQVLKE